MRDVHYAQAEDGTHIAYCPLEPDDDAVADREIVMVSGGLIAMGSFEENRGMARLLDGLRRLGRVVVFDRRGIGVSDPVTDWDRPILEQWADDLAAVVDACDIRDAVLFSWDNYGVATRFAARHPGRVGILVLHHPYFVADVDWDTESAERLAQINDVLTGGRDDFMSQIAPTRADDLAFREWYGRAGRTGASPATAARIWRSVFSTPPSEQLLHTVTAPTVVLARRGNRWIPVESARAAVSQIPGATLVELEGADHFPFVGDVDEVLAELARAIVGEHQLPPPDTALAAVVFTDLVGSTERAAALGDERWRSVLDRHDACIRAAVGRGGGTVVKTTGDGVLALMPSAGEALRVARRVHAELGADGLSARVGIHVGDVDRRGDDVSGLAVHVAARVMAAAGAGETVVTASATAALPGRHEAFEPVGRRELKGVPGRWDLFRVKDNGQALTP